ncbi:MAG TPA: acyltransferase, partial [Tepidisphaeraceae bacterium]
MTAPDPTPPSSIDKPRVIWVDYAKGLSILLVVLYHVLNGLAKRRADVPVPAAWDELINPMLEMVRMPLFFFVSGLFVARSAQKDARTYITDKLGAITWPYLIWSIIQAVLLIVLAKVSRGKPDVTLAELPYALAFAPVFQFWFLYVLFMALMLYFALVKLRFRPWMILTVAVGLLLIKLNVDLRPLGFETDRYRIGLAYWGPLLQLFNFFIYMALGSVLGGFLLKRTDRLPIGLLAGVAVVGTALVVWAVAGLNLRRDSTADLGLLVPLGLFFALASVAAGLAVATLLSRSGVTGFVRTAGQFSLYIFVLHVIFAAGVRTVLLKAGVKDLTIHIVAGTIAGVLLPILV